MLPLSVTFPHFRPCWAYLSRPCLPAPPKFSTHFDWLLRYTYSSPPPTFTPETAPSQPHCRREGGPQDSVWAVCYRMHGRELQRVAALSGSWRRAWVMAETFTHG
jgi:hypothetical protein